jgi:hypothetical protein
MDLDEAERRQRFDDHLQWSSYPDVAASRDDPRVVLG